MAYMDDQAQERDAIRQRILAGLPQIDFKGLPFEGPQGVKQTPIEPLRVLPAVGTRGTPTAALPQQQQQDTGIGGAIAGFLGGANVNRDSAIKQMIQQREQWVKGHPNEVPPWQPGAKQINKPGSPNAQSLERSAMSPDTPGVTESKTLAEQRAGIAKELDGNAATKLKLATLMVAEEGGDSEARTALAETAMNRNVANNMGSMEKTLNPEYYAPFKDGGYAKAAARLQSDPKLLQQVYSEIDKASKGGSNVSNFATDNGSGTVAANARTNQAVAFTGKNGELFSRKEDPSVHGSWGTNGKAWYDRTAGSVADEQPGQQTTKVAGDNVVPQQPPPPSRGSLEPTAKEQPPTMLSPQPIEQTPVAPPAAAPATPTLETPGLTPKAPSVQVQAVTPQAEPPARASAAPVPPPAPAAPPPTPKADLNGLHKWFDGNVVTGINELMPGQGSNVPLLGRGMSVRSAAKMAPTEQIKPLIDAAAKKYGVSPKQLMDEVGKPPPAPGKSSEAEPPPGEQPQAVASAQPGPQGAPQQPAPTITPGEAKAVVEAVKPDAGPPVQVASAAPPPVVVPPPDAPPVNGAPGAGAGVPVVPNAPMPVQTSLAPNPMASAQINSAQSPFQMWQPPVPWDTLQSWGWGSGGEGNTGFSGGGFDMAGGEGFSGFGGFGMPG